MIEEHNSAYHFVRKENERGVCLSAVVVMVVLVVRSSNLVMSS